MLHRPSLSIATLSWVLGLVVLAGAAFAHSPYVSRTTNWIAPDGARFTIAVLYGDGIVASDPGRPVVLDGAGQVVALGPLVHDAFVHCRTEGDCIVLLDPIGGGLTAPQSEAIAPDPSAFRPGRSADFYPEHEKVAFGFKPVPIAAADRWVFWTVPFRRAPKLASAFGLLFAGFGFLSGWVLAPAWRIRHEFASRAAGFAVFLYAWAAGAFVAAIVPLIVMALNTWLFTSAFNQRLLAVAFCVGFPAGVLVAYVRTVRPSLARRAAASAFNVASQRHRPGA